jgi:hypothetical protein
MPRCVRIGRLEAVEYQELAAQSRFQSAEMPGEGFEPPTFGLQNRCTTTVLTRPKSIYYNGFYGFCVILVNLGASDIVHPWHSFARSQSNRQDSLRWSSGSNGQGALTPIPSWVGARSQWAARFLIRACQGCCRFGLHSPTAFNASAPSQPLRPINPDAIYHAGTFIRELPRGLRWRSGTLAIGSIVTLTLNPTSLAALVMVVRCTAAFSGLSSRST